MLQRVETPTPEMIANVKRLMDTMRGFVNAYPANLVPINKMLLARHLEVVEKNAAGAAALFDEAIVALRDTGFPLWEGKVLLLAGNNAASLSMRSAAEHLYTDACRVWAGCGAATLVAAAVRKMTSASSELTAVHRPSVPPTAQLDAYTILQVTRALSQEIVLDKLMDEVITILLDNSGADKVMLLMEKLVEKTLEVVAQRHVGDQPGTSSPLPPTPPLETADRNTGAEQQVAIDAL
jgi:hypothetical protein